METPAEQAPFCTDRLAEVEGVHKWRVAAWEIPKAANSSQTSRDDEEEGKMFSQGPREDTLEFIQPGNR